MSDTASGPVSDRVVNDLPSNNLPSNDLPSNEASSEREEEHEELEEGSPSPSPPLPPSPSPRDSGVLSPSTGTITTIKISATPLVSDLSDKLTSLQQSYDAHVQTANDEISGLKQALGSIQEAVEFLARTTGSQKKARTSMHYATTEYSNTPIPKPVGEAVDKPVPVVYEEDMDSSDDEFDTVTQKHVVAPPLVPTTWEYGSAPASSLVFYCANNRNILKSTVASIAIDFLSQEPWMLRPNFVPATPDDRARVVATAKALLIPGKQPYLAYAPSLANNVSCIILYEGKKPVSVATFTLFLRAGRSFIEVHNMRTSKPYRRRGHGSLNVALMKELACKTPLKDVVESAFLWASVTQRSWDFFSGEKVRTRERVGWHRNTLIAARHPPLFTHVYAQRGFLNGWGKLKQIFSELPEMKDGGGQAHVMLMPKSLIGEYLYAAVNEQNHPVIEGSVVKPKLNDWDSVAEFTVGTTVHVRYPRMTSTKLYTAIVLDYNPLRTKPYMVKYTAGGELDYVVPKRIMDKETLLEDADDEGLWIGDHAHTPPPQDEDDDVAVEVVEVVEVVEHAIAVEGEEGEDDVDDEGGQPAHALFGNMAPGGAAGGGAGGGGVGVAPAHALFGNIPPPAPM